ncbi:TonB-dependent receptor [Sphingomonas oligophenolica]
MRKFSFNSSTALSSAAFISSAFIVAGTLASPSYAQTTDPQQTSAVSAPQSADSQPAEPPHETDVVVTGSRIAHRGNETASPLQTISSQDLDARGYQTVAQALNELPSFGVPGASPVGFNQSGFGAGQSFVDFLGLGSQRTLTLVNGRRFVSGNTSSIFGPTGSGGNQVDLNVIPTKLIDRVETVAAIGAPIYGSDAIAGTINIILKKDYQGIDVDAETGISRQGDAPEYRLRLLAGRNFAGGRGNITIAGEYDESKGLFFDDRAQTASDNRFGVSRTGSGPQPIYPDNRIPSVSPYGIPIVGGANVGLDLTLTPQQSNLFFGDPTLNFGVNNSAGTQLKFDQQGNLIPIIYGNTIGPDSSFNVFTSGGNGFTLRDVENLVTDIKRYSGNIEASFDLTPNVRLFGEGWYSVSQGTNLAAQPVYNSGLFGAAGTRDGNLIISINNPFLSPAARAAIQNSINNNPLSDQNNPFGDPALNGITQDYFYLGRANVDLSSGVSTGKSEVIRFVGGMDGTLHVLPDRDWRFEAYFNYGRSHVTSRNPELNEQNFLNAINAVNGPGGSIICAPGFTNSPIATLSSTCAPINPFGNQVSQAAKDYITTIATPSNINNQYDAVASVAGPLFKLPGGDFSFALGFEHRAEDSTFDPGAFYYGSGTGNSSQRGSYGRSVPIDPVFGKYYTNEIFGELNADLIGSDNDIPFVHELSIQTAGRYIWNSQAGGDPTYTIQGRYAPVRDIAFRAAYTRAVRAPSITEAFNPTSSAFGFATDVCDMSLVNSGPDPVTRAKNCAAAGVPANFVSQSNNRSFPTYTFGNSALQNEKSDNFTVGAVFTPRFIPGFSMTVDYVNITLKNAISQFSTDQVVAACYDATNYPSNPFCSLVTRDFSGTPGSLDYAQLSNVGTSYFNSATLKYKGILAEVSYRTATDFLGQGSHIGLDINYQYLDTLSTIVTEGSVPVHTSNSVGYSPHKGVATIRYDRGIFFGQVQINYIGKTRIDPDTVYNFYAVPEVNAFTYVNMSFKLDVTKNFSLNLDVDNVFDVKAPYPYSASGGTTTYFQGILGRYMRFGAAVHF